MSVGSTRLQLRGKTMHASLFWIACPYYIRICWVSCPIFLAAIARSHRCNCQASSCKCWRRRLDSQPSENPWLFAFWQICRIAKPQNIFGSASKRITLTIYVFAKVMAFKLCSENKGWYDMIFLVPFCILLMWIDCLYAVYIPSLRLKNM